MRLYQAIPLNALLLLIALTAVGCTTYYQIQDPESGHIYYSDNLKMLDDGAVRFTDAQSGNEVTIQDSDIKEIPEDEFDIRRYQETPAETEK